MNLRLRNLALLLAPTVILTGWMLSLVFERSAQPSMRIVIDGYDPRDLLRGHYLQFRLSLSGPAINAPCACLQANPADARRPAAAPAQCDAPPPADCPYFIRRPGQTYRYYASQEQAVALQEKLRLTPNGASALVHFHGDGEVSFSDVQDGR